MTARAVGASSERRWRSVLALAVAELVSWGVVFYAYGVLLRPLAGEMGASEEAVAAGFSVLLLTGGLAARAVGRAVDRWGARRVMTAASLVAFLALASLAFVRTPAVLYAACAGLGVAHAGLSYEPAFAAATAWFPGERERLRALLVITTVAGLASTAFVPLTAALVGSMGVRHAILVLAALFVVVTTPLHASLADAPRDGVVPADASAPVVATRDEGPPRVAPLATMFALHAFVSAAVGVHLVGRLLDTGVSLARAASIAGLLGVAQVGGRSLATISRSLLGASGRLPLFFATQAIALALLARGASGLSLSVAVLAFGAANGLVTLERATLVAACFGTASYGETSGRVARAGLVARAAAPAGVAVASARLGPEAAFYGLSCALALAALVAWTFLRPLAPARVCRACRSESSPPP